MTLTCKQCSHQRIHDVCILCTVNVYYIQQRFKAKTSFDMIFCHMVSNYYNSKMSCSFTYSFPTLSKHAIIIYWHFECTSEIIQHLLQHFVNIKNTAEQRSFTVTYNHNAYPISSATETPPKSQSYT